MSNPYPSRVVKYGAFWKVQTFRSGAWVQHSDNYLTKREALDGRFYWAQR